MIRRWLPILLLCCRPLSGQWAFSLLQNNLETPVDTQIQLDATASTDTRNALFRVRNGSKSTASLNVLSIAGTAFSLADLPALPANLLPGAYLDFTVRFQPTGAGSFSALLKADGVSVFVLASATPVLTISVQDNGVRRPIDPSSAVGFGAVERGSQSVRHFLLQNQTGQPMVSAISVAGAAFQLAAGSPAALALDPLESAQVDVVFAPATAGSQQGELRIDQRRFFLTGTTVEPPLPKPFLVIDFQDRQPASAMQPTVAVRFDPAPRTSGTGKLRIDFHPSIAACDDPAIQLLPTSSRTIDFSVIEGEPDAQFGSAVSVPWQTGTTAGTVIFTAELGGYAETANVEIPPQPVAITSVQLTGGETSIEVRVSGYDNTQSISLARFTFLRKDGSVIPPGVIEQNLAAAFQDYFAHSSLGGTFEMKAAFPITGGIALVDSVRLVITNQSGNTSWP